MNVVTVDLDNVRLELEFRNFYLRDLKCTSFIRETSFAMFRCVGCSEKR